MEISFQELNIRHTSSKHILSFKQNFSQRSLQNTKKKSNSWDICQTGRQGVRGNGLGVKTTLFDSSQKISNLKKPNKKSQDLRR